MKKYLLFALGCFPLTVSAQRVVMLSFYQPPPLTYEVPPGSNDLAMNKGDSVILASDLKVLGGSGNYIFRWSPGATLSDSSNMKPVAKPAENTTYTLTVTDKNGCSFMLGYQVTVKQQTPSLKIPGNKPDLSVWVYPNPADGTVFIQLKGKPSKTVNILLTDNLGRTLMHLPVNDFPGEQVITLQPGVAPGIFILSVKRESEVIQKKLIIR